MKPMSRIVVTLALCGGCASSSGDGPASSAGAAGQSSTSGGTTSTSGASGLGGTQSASGSAGAAAGTSSTVTAGSAAVSGAAGTGSAGTNAGGSGGSSAGASGSGGGGGSLSGGGAAGADASGGTGGGVGGGSSKSAGCGKAVTRPDRKTQQTISISGTTRYYLLNVPANANSDTPLPLVFALHGYDMNNLSLVDLYDFTAESGNQAITVLPQGEGPAPGNTSHWGDQVLKSTWSGNAANYGFMEALKAEIESRYCVDTKRVFMTGFSMGGLFTNSLACEHSDWFRGYAPVEGGGPGSCANANAKPAVMVHQGTADTIAKPSAGEGTRDFWLGQNGCNQTMTNMYTGCQSYGACASPVVYCLGNWDHTVPRTARANIWAFFNGLH